MEKGIHIFVLFLPNVLSYFTCAQNPDFAFYKLLSALAVCPDLYRVEVVWVPKPNQTVSQRRGKK